MPSTSIATPTRRRRERAIAVRDVLVGGDRAAVRATWTGVVGVDAGPFTKGARIVAEMGGFLRVRDGLVVEHETCDCYEPFTSVVNP